MDITNSNDNASEITMPILHARNTAKSFKQVTVEFACPNIFVDIFTEYLRKIYSFRLYQYLVGLNGLLNPIFMNVGDCKAENIALFHRIKRLIETKNIVMTKYIIVDEAEKVTAYYMEAIKAQPKRHQFISVTKSSSEFAPRNQSLFIMQQLLDSEKKHYNFLLTPIDNNTAICFIKADTLEQLFINTKSTNIFCQYDNFEISSLVYISALREFYYIIVRYNCTSNLNNFKINANYAERLSKLVVEKMKRIYDYWSNGNLEINNAMKIRFFYERKLKKFQTQLICDLNSVGLFDVNCDLVLINCDNIGDYRTLSYRLMNFLDHAQNYLLNYK